MWHNWSSYKSQCGGIQYYFLIWVKKILFPVSAFFVGLWIVNGENIVYSQEVIFTFWCPMRFEQFPLDSQTCKFQVKVMQKYKKVIIVEKIKYRWIKLQNLLFSSTYIHTISWQLCLQWYKTNINYIWWQLCLQWYKTM